MKIKVTRLCAMAMAILMWVLLLPIGAIAADANTVKSALEYAAKYIYQTVKAPQIGSIGGEWAVIGLARSGFPVPDSYYQAYISAVESYVKASDGVIHEKKYTEYSRVVLALTAIGKDPRDVAGYDLLAPLGDFEKTIWQGLNGPIFALIALDSVSYPMPINEKAAVQATREMYVDEILCRQLNDGGFSLTGGTTESNKSDPADPDITAMALQALAKYQERADVKTAVDRAVARLSEMQKSDGGFASYGIANSESVVQVIVALGELGIAVDDPRFIKNGCTAVDALLSYAQEDGGFLHTAEGAGSNQMAAEQGLYGLASAVRLAEGQNSLYRMEDAIAISTGTETQPTPGSGLPGKHKDIQYMPVTLPGRTFEDVRSHQSQPAIEALASREIINGKSEAQFDPDATMTRAEFCTIVVNSLGLIPMAETVFSDVPADSWYAGHVSTAYSYGIVTGTSSTTFKPNGTITRQEAAVMVARAAKLAGMETSLTAAEIRDMLAQFTDYTTSADWSREALAFCYGQNLFDQSDMEISPLAKITRGEIAEVLYRLLGAANLI